MTILMLRRHVRGFEVSGGPPGEVASPHLRPLDWLILASLHKKGTKTAKEKIAALDLDRPMPFTGQIMLDGSHKPCTPGQPRNPKRISSWEIHPVYAIDVSNKKTLSSCRVSVEGEWKPLHVFLQDDEA